MRSLSIFVLAAVLHAPPIPLSTPGVRVVRGRLGKPVQAILYRTLSRIENCRVWNNPGCLKFARQVGATLGPRGYAVFHTLADGQRALKKRIAFRRRPDG